MATKKQKSKPKKGMSTTLKVVGGLALLGVGGYLGYTQWQGMQAKKELEGTIPKGTTTGTQKVASSDILKVGVKSSDVRELQNFLNRKAAVPLVVDDSFGEKTATELKLQTGFTKITKAQFKAWQNTGTYNANVGTPTMSMNKSVTLPKAQKIYDLLFKDGTVITINDFKNSNIDGLLNVLKSIGSKEEYDEVNYLYKLITLDKMTYNAFRNKDLSSPLKSIVFSAAQLEQIKNAVGRFF